ncbi:hypothetical protein [Sphingobacterium faecale]|uniref:Uncharacterized protein n=1 Tax=Sphingobacterium faecale TaxID=2803775 RepID=A0ABS1QYZ3_9SPHI|nr:hypothetical protein [Sphingobacterium faecale]MBL1407645.1 hypothetical protein [Sphingobacterium faecale]
MLKNIKNYAMALGGLAIALSLTFMSFKASVVEKTSRKTLSFQTWRFVETVDSDPTNPENYVLQQLSDPPCGTIEKKICTITAPDDGNGLPDLQEQMFDPVTNNDQTIEHLIDRAQTSLSSTPTTNVAVLAFKNL